jgi:hypothetical protein
MKVGFERTMMFIAAVLLASIPVHAQGTAVNAQYTGSAVPLDGNLGAVWNTATAYPIANAYGTTNYNAPTAACNAQPTLRALWDGAKLYVMVSVADPNVVGGSTFNGAAVEFWVDHFNDKVQKFEEDDGMFDISAPNVSTGAVGVSANGTNAGDNIYPNLTDRYLAGYKSALQKDGGGNVIGYNVEFAWYIGDHVSAIGNHASLNGSTIGFDSTVYVADNGTSTTRTCRMMLSPSTADRTTNNNQPWGTITLTGYNASTSAPMAVDTFLLNTNIGAATQATFGNLLPPVTNKATWAAASPAIWTDLTALNTALTAARTAQTSTTQSTIDNATTALDAALKGLKRNGPYPNGGGPYPDPYDLPNVNYLNDPFTFMDGTKVKSRADWDRRRQEIKSIAQYYEFGWVPPAPAVLTATSSGSGVTKTIAMNIVANNGNVWTNANGAKLTLPTGTTVNGKTAPWPVIVSIDLAGTPGTPPAAYLAAGYAVLDIGYTMWANDGPTPSGAINTLYPFDINAGHDYGSLMGWAWGASRAVDAVQYLLGHDATYTVVNGTGQTVPMIDMNKLSVIGFSRCGKAALAAGFLDDRFKVTAPGGSGNGGAAPYRYAADNNSPNGPKNSPGHVYWWSNGAGAGGEAMGDHIRHNTWNVNEMARSFLNDQDPRTVQPRMYRQYSWGYGTRLPFDHHMEIAAIAPRAVLLDESSDDYADEAEGDAVGWEGALPVFKYLGVQQNLALDTYMEVNNPAYHSLKTPQASNFISFLDFQLYGIPLPTTVPTGDNAFVLPANAVPTNAKLYTDFFLTGAADHTSIYDKYYGGLSTMMPWLTSVPHANLLTGLTESAGAISPAFSSGTTSYSSAVPSATTSTTITPTAEDPNATITVNGTPVASGTASPSIPLTAGANTINIAVTSVDGVTLTYQDIITPGGYNTTTALSSSNLNSNLNASVTFTAMVTSTTGPTSPTGTVAFMDGANLLGTGTLSSTSATVSKATYTTSALTAGTHSITATYAANGGFNASNATAISQVVTAPAIQTSYSPATLSITSGSSGTSTLTVTPVGGFTGTVNITCGTILPAHMSCSFSTGTLTFTASSGPQTSTVTIGTTNTSALIAPARPGSRTTGSMELALLGFPVLGWVAIRMRKQGKRIVPVLGILMIVSLGMLAAVTGCGGNGNSGKTVSGSYSVPVNVTVNGVTTNAPLNVTVQ